MQQSPLTKFKASKVRARRMRFQDLPMDIIIIILDYIVDTFLVDVLRPIPRNLLLPRYPVRTLGDYRSLLLTCKTFHNLLTQSRFPISSGLLSSSSDPHSKFYLFWRGEESDLPTPHGDSDVRLIFRVPSTCDLRSIFECWQLKTLTRYNVNPKFLNDIFYYDRLEYGNFHLNPRFGEPELSHLIEQYSLDGFAQLLIHLPGYFWTSKAVPFNLPYHGQLLSSVRESLTKNGIHVGTALNFCVIGSRISFKEWTCKRSDYCFITSKDLTMDEEVEWWAWNLHCKSTYGTIFGCSKEGYKWIFNGSRMELYTSFHKRGKAAKKLNQKFKRDMTVWHRGMKFY